MQSLREIHFRQAFDTPCVGCNLTDIPKVKKNTARAEGQAILQCLFDRVQGRRCKMSLPGEFFDGVQAQLQERLDYLAKMRN